MFIMFHTYWIFVCAPVYDTQCGGIKRYEMISSLDGEDILSTKEPYLNVMVKWRSKARSMMMREESMIEVTIGKDQRR